MACWIWPPGPGGAALLRGLPPFGVIALGLSTGFAGYTAVYALNDLVDYRVDQEKLKAAGPALKPGYLDAIFMRHPLAQGRVGFGEGVLWVAAWAGWPSRRLPAQSRVRLYLPGRLPAGGGLLPAAPGQPSQDSGQRPGQDPGRGGRGLRRVPAPLQRPCAPVVSVVFCWEIGGQNIPADWHDLEEIDDWAPKPSRCTAAPREPAPWPWGPWP